MPLDDKVREALDTIFLGDSGPIGTVGMAARLRCLAERHWRRSAG